MKTHPIAILAMLFAPLLAAQPPAIYNRIGHLVWIVRDLNRDVQAWPPLGLTDVHNFGEISYHGDYRARPVTGRMRLAEGRLGSLAVDLMQPLAADSAFRAFQANHGDGIFSIVYEASKDEVAKEEKRLSAAGAPVLQRLQMETSRGAADFTFFDTEPQGKYVLGLVTGSGGPSRPADAKVISHVAFAIRQPQPVSDFWQRLGFPAMPVSHASPREDSRYRGASTAARLRCGLAPLHAARLRMDHTAANAAELLRRFPDSPRRGSAPSWCTGR